MIFSHILDCVCFVKYSNPLAVIHSDNSAWISSRLLPMVSTNCVLGANTHNTEKAQATVKPVKIICCPSDDMSVPKNCVMQNEPPQASTDDMAEARLLYCEGKSSPTISHGTGPQPKEKEAM
mmetsp:Transcript_27595/g.89893  ORF Transcript_27595/g.89893 Transcript_27595/m.89893 type:complete len:122 (-) Transcript_27595:1951-2316(-)